MRLAVGDDRGPARGSLAHELSEAGQGPSRGGTRAQPTTGGPVRCRAAMPRVAQLPELSSPPSRYGNTVMACSVPSGASVRPVGGRHRREGELQARPGQGNDGVHRRPQVCLSRGRAGATPASGQASDGHERPAARGISQFPMVIAKAHRQISQPGRSKTPAIRQDARQLTLIDPVRRHSRRSRLGATRTAPG
jgi:hypothetical protein